MTEAGKPGSSRLPTSKGSPATPLARLDRAMPSRQGEKSYERDRKKVWRSNADNKQKERTRMSRRRREREAIISIFVWKLKASSNGCIDCGERDPIVLDFDHKNGITKLFTISSARAKLLSLEKIKAEIAKCDIRCSNCHRRRTALEGNHYKSFRHLPLFTKTVKT